MKAKYEKPIVEIISLEVEENLMDEDDEDEGSAGGGLHPGRPF